MKHCYDTFVNEINMDTKTVEDLSELTAVDDDGDEEDCLIVTVDLKRKKPGILSHGRAKCAKIESYDAGSVGEGDIKSEPVLADKIASVDTPAATSASLQDANQAGIEKAIVVADGKGKSGLAGCAVCRKIFKDSQSLLVHMTRKHSSNVAPVEKIEKKLPSGSFKCAACSSQFPTLQELVKHGMALGHYQTAPGTSAGIPTKPKGPPPTLICDTCGALFQNDLELDNHHATHYGRSYPSHNCNECSRKFSFLRHLVHHKKTQRHEDRVRICRFCNKSFKQRTAAQDHLELTHGISQCESRAVLDQNVFTIFSENLKEPVEASNGQNSGVSVPTKYVYNTNPLEFGDIYNCEICEQAFQNPQDLMKHSFLHDYGHHQLCPICDEDFEDIDSLKSHMSTHRGSKDYLVPAHLSRHVRIHAANVDKPYLCNFCGMGYSRIGLLPQHLMRHKDGFSCEICGENLLRGTCRAKCDVEEV